MTDRFTSFPSALAPQTRSVRLGRSGIPALLIHPDWQHPAPFVFWMHGRTVSKEIDPARYLRWMRAGIAACAIDLPGHGQRLDPAYHAPEKNLEVLEQVLPEIDEALEALLAPDYQSDNKSLFDPARAGIGGMSAGGMAALRRLCDPHGFRCAAVEATSGDLEALYHPESGRRWVVRHPPDRIARLDPSKHLDGWRPIPLLALHTEADRIVPIQAQRRFLEALREQYRTQGVSPDTVELVTWPRTGAPYEHSGFGRVAHEARSVQAKFLVRHLAPDGAESKLD